VGWYRGVGEVEVGLMPTRSELSRGGGEYSELVNVGEKRRGKRGLWTEKMNKYWALRKIVSKPGTLNERSGVGKLEKGMPPGKR